MCDDSSKWQDIGSDLKQRADYNICLLKLRLNLAQNCRRQYKIDFFAQKITTMLVNVNKWGPFKAWGFF